MTLYEATGKLGGQFRLARQIPGKDEFEETLRYYHNQLQLHGVNVQLNTKPKPSDLKDFDEIVRCFLPDLTRHDGSYDLVLGGSQDNGGPRTVRVIDDFIPPG